MHLLIDADTPCFAAAVVHEQNDAQQAIWEVHASIERLIADVGATSVKMFLTGDTNFRYTLFPEYKRERLHKPRPRHLGKVKDSLVRSYGAIVSVGCEADDLLSIEQISYNKYGQEESIIASIDKDLNQVVGWHYHPGIKRKGKWIVETKRFVVSPREACQFFYTQLLVGDAADGIKGAVGIGKNKAEDILKGAKTEWEFYERCLDCFSCEEELFQNARCCYLLQKEGQVWQPPTVDGGSASFLHSECATPGDTTLAPEIRDIE